MFNYLFSFHRLQVITYLLKRKYLHWEMFWYWRRERGPQLCVRKWPGAATTVQTSSSGLLNFPSWFYFPWKSSQQGTITFPYLLSFKHHVTIFSTYLWTYFHDAPNVFILIKRKHTGKLYFLREKWPLLNFPFQAPLQMTTNYSR